MARLVLVIGIVVVAQGIARAEPPWEHGTPSDVGEQDGWEVGADVVGAPFGGAGVELEGALRHDGVLAHVARIAWTEESIENDDLTSDPGMFTNQSGAASLGERACAWGFLCGELGLGGDLGWVHVKGSESQVTGGAFGLARAMVRFPIGPLLLRAGVEGELGGVGDARFDVFAGIAVRW